MRQFLARESVRRTVGVLVGGIELPEQERAVGFGNERPDRCGDGRTVAIVGGDHTGQAQGVAQ